MSLNVVIIGAVALGPKVGSRIKRIMPKARVTMVDRDSIISYGGCGIPYFVSGDVNEPRELQETSAHVLRDANFFKNAKGFDVLTRTEAVKIDRENKSVLVRNLDSGEEQSLPYDKLVLGLGSVPNRLPINGLDLDGVFTVSSLNEAIKIKAKIAAGEVGRAVVIGGGAIGIEMVEALTDLWGVETALVEIQDQLLPGILSPNIAKMLQQHLAENDVNEIYLSERVERIEGNGAVERVVTNKRTIEADMVILAAGVHPNAELAKNAGLELSENRAILVNEFLQTSDPDIYAGGDCIDNNHLITGKRVYTPLGSLANRQGRVIGTNVAGGSEKFEGVVGSFVLKAFELSVGSVGLTLPMARRHGFDAFSAFVVQADRAHFYPDMELMYLEMTVDRTNGNVLGVQGASSKPDALATRIDAAAAILKYKPTVKDISNLELAYAPPFASAMDILNALGNTAENIMEGKNKTIELDEFAELFENRKNGDMVCLDVRSPQNAEEFIKKFPDVWVNIPQEELRGRIEEVPRDKELIVLCNSGVRSYEAQLILEENGIDPGRNLQGGWGALRKWGLPLVD